MKYKVGDMVKLKDALYNETGEVEFTMKDLFGKVVRIISVDSLQFYKYAISYDSANYGIKEDEIVGKVEDDNKVVV